MDALRGMGATTHDVGISSVRDLASTIRCGAMRMMGSNGTGGGGERTRLGGGGEYGYPALFLRGCIRRLVRRGARMTGHGPYRGLLTRTAFLIPANSSKSKQGLTIGAFS